MTYQEVLHSIWGSNPPQLDKDDIERLDKKYEDIRKRIDSNLDYFTKLCVLNSYAHEQNIAVSRLNNVADQLTEFVDDYVFYRICNPEEE